ETLGASSALQAGDSQTVDSQKGDSQTGDSQTGTQIRWSQLRWKEQSLEFDKTKRGWVMRPVEDAAYVKGEVALQVLSARLADLARNAGATAEQKREQRQIIRLLNLLVTD